VEQTPEPIDATLDYTLFGEFNFNTQLVADDALLPAPTSAGDDATATHPDEDVTHPQDTPSALEQSYGSEPHAAAALNGARIPGQHLNLVHVLGDMDSAIASPSVTAQAAATGSPKLVATAIILREDEARVPSSTGVDDREPQQAIVDGDERKVPEDDVPMSFGAPAPLFQSRAKSREASGAWPSASQVSLARSDQSES